MPEWASQVGGAAAPVLAVAVVWLWREYLRLSRALGRVQEARVSDAREMVAAIVASTAALHEAAGVIRRLGAGREP